MIREDFHSFIFSRAIKKSRREIRDGLFALATPKASFMRRIWEQGSPCYAAPVNGNASAFPPTENQLLVCELSGREQTSRAPAPLLRRMQKSALSFLRS